MSTHSSSVRRAQRSSRSSFSTWLFIFTVTFFVQVFTYASLSYGVSQTLGWSSVHNIIAIVGCGLDLFVLLPIIFSKEFKQNPSIIWYLFGVWMLVTATYQSFVHHGVIVLVLTNHPEMAAGAAGIATLFVVCLYLVHAVIVGILADKLSSI